MDKRPNRRPVMLYPIADRLQNDAMHEANERDPDQLGLLPERRERRLRRRTQRSRLQRYTVRFTLPDGLLSRLIIVQCPTTGYILSYRLMPEIHA